MDEKVTPKKSFHRDLGLHIQYVCRLCCNETDSCTKMVIVYKHLSSNKGISVYELIGTITKQCLFLLLYEIFGLITLVDNATPNDLPRECKLLSHIGQSEVVAVYMRCSNTFLYSGKVKKQKKWAFGNFLSSQFFSLMQIVNADKATRGVNTQNFNFYYVAICIIQVKQCDKIFPNVGNISSHITGLNQGFLVSGHAKPPKPEVSVFWILQPRSQGSILDSDWLRDAMHQLGCGYSDLNRGIDQSGFAQ